MSELHLCFMSAAAVAIRACSRLFSDHLLAHMQGISRYDAMTKMTSPILYKGFAGSGHLIFTSAELPEAVTMVGDTMADLWIESSDEDADVFVYLLDYDPQTRVSR